MLNKEKSLNPNQEPARRLSPLRIVLAVMLLTAISYTVLTRFMDWQQTQGIRNIDPWFASYVDVTATPRYAFEQLGTTPVKNVVLAFIVSDLENSCIPSWGTYYTLDEAGEKLDLDRRIARYRQLGGNVMVSFGGLANDELALNCHNEEQLLNAYLEVVERYEVDTIDLDLEGESLKDKEALRLRASVIKVLQEKLRNKNKNLAVWLTLPVSPQGLTPAGIGAVEQMLKSGVDLAGVNVMTMNYGASRNTQYSMSQATEMALTETHRQLSIIYQQAGINLNTDTLWKKIGATPMIGQNDVVNEVFTLDDAKSLNEFSLNKNISRLSIWSANRDVQCGENYVNLTTPSDSCSGIKQEEHVFSNLLMQGFDGRISVSAKMRTIEDAVPTVIQDDPNTSPYQIWNENGVYLQGTKVVWHGNVYQAKWWTKGDLPDNPVLQAWETPWQLIGPVLPGETPIQQPNLPAGTYPDWSGLEIYEAGQRVLFEGVPYQAKWWTQGDSPAASSSNPDSSPWILLTQIQIEQILQSISES